MLPRFLILIAFVLIGCASTPPPCPQKVHVIEIPSPAPAKMPDLAFMKPAMNKTWCSVWHPSLRLSQTVFALVLIEGETAFVPVQLEGQTYDKAMEIFGQNAIPIHGPMGDAGWLIWCKPRPDTYFRSQQTRLY